MFHNLPGQSIFPKRHLCFRVLSEELLLSCHGVPSQFLASYVASLNKPFAPQHLLCFFHFPFDALLAFSLFSLLFLFVKQKNSFLCFSLLLFSHQSKSRPCCPLGVLRLSFSQRGYKKQKQRPEAWMVGVADPSGAIPAGHIFLPGGGPWPDM